jgi:hypothetical protein
VSFLALIGSLAQAIAAVPALTRFFELLILEYAKAVDSRNKAEAIQRHAQKNEAVAAAIAAVRERQRMRDTGSQDDAPAQP